MRDSKAELLLAQVCHEGTEQSRWSKAKSCRSTKIRPCRRVERITFPFLLRCIRRFLAQSGSHRRSAGCLLPRANRTPNLLATTSACDPLRTLALARNWLAVL